MLVNGADKKQRICETWDEKVLSLLIVVKGFVIQTRHFPNAGNPVSILCQLKFAW